MVTATPADVIASYAPLAALAALTMHVPGREARSALPEMAQPLAVPFFTVNVTLPGPDPPVAMRRRALPTWPLRGEIFKGDCNIAVTKYTRSPLKVRVTSRFDVAVATSRRPEGVNSKIGSPGLMFGLVMTKFNATLAVGTEPSGACHDIATAMMST